MTLAQVHLDETILSRLDAVAHSLARSREDLLREAVGNYLELMELRAAVERGRTDIARGAVYSAEETEAYFAQMRTELRTRIAQ